MNEIIPVLFVGCQGFVADQNVPVITGDKDALPGANGQTTDDVGWTVVKKTYAHVLKRGAQVKWRCRNAP